MDAILIVDGFSMVQADILHGDDRANWWKPESQTKIAAVAETFGERRFAQIWLIFEGPSGSAPPRESDAIVPKKTRVRVFRAPQADEWILAQVRRASPDRKFTVVTGEEDLQAILRDLGADLLDPDSFLSQCATPKEKP